MISAAADLARRLARDAEAVCRHYLSKGRRSGRYWIAGDVQNTPGRSLYVRLSGPDYGPGAAGHWTDAATGEHGDLLDLIALNRDLPRLTRGHGRSAALSCPAASGDPQAGAFTPQAQPMRGSSEAARRLFHAGRPVPGTPAEAYLRARGITARSTGPPCASIPPSITAQIRAAANSNLGRRCSPPSPRLTAPSAASSAPGSTAAGPPRRHSPIRAARSAVCSAMAYALAKQLTSSPPAKASRRCSRSNPCCPPADDRRAVGQPSRRSRSAIVAAPALCRARQRRGRLQAAERLHERATPSDIDVRELVPVHADFNLDLCRLGADGLREHLAGQLVAPDRTRFLPEVRPLYPQP